MLHRWLEASFPFYSIGIRQVVEMELAGAGAGKIEACRLAQDEIAERNLRLADLCKIALAVHPLKRRRRNGICLTRRRDANSGTMPHLRHSSKASHKTGHDLFTPFDFCPGRSYKPRISPLTLPLSGLKHSEKTAHPLVTAGREIAG